MNTDPQKTPHLVMAPDNTSDDENIDLLALLLALLRGWKTILAFALLGLIIGVLYSRYVNPTFKSDALIQIDENSSGISALGENISDLIGSDVNNVQTEAELIKSRMVLEPVVDLLHLDINLSDPKVSVITKIKNNRTDTQLNIPEGVALATADGKVQVSQFDVPQSYLGQTFTLTRSNSETNNDFVLSNGFDDFKGQLGTAHQFKAVDGIIKIIVNDLPVNDHAINISKQSLQTTTDSINSSLSVIEMGKQTGVIQLSLTGANQQQVSLILKEIIISYIGQNQSHGSEETTKTIKFMETQIPVLKQKLESAEEVFNDFRKKYGTIDVSKEAELLLTENSQIDAQLNELKLKKADLTTYYTEEHPLVIQINDQLKVLSSRRQEIDNKIVSLPEIQRDFLKLSQDTEINREIYLTLLKNYQQLQIAKAGQVGYARIIDLPISTFKEIAPKKLLIWTLALFLGLMIGSMLVLIKNMFRKVIKDPEQLESKTGIPVIATIPRSQLLIRSNKNSADRLLAYVDSNSLSYEAIKSLRTNLIFSLSSLSKVGQSAKVILITSESPEVGKSFISANLSEVFAQLEKKILVIDADMRQGKLHKMFNMTQDNGLADYLTQGVALETVVHPTAIDNIDFIPKGQHAHNPSALLSGDLFQQMMIELNEHYDYIVIDTPPTLAASDALIVSKYADKVLMVARFDKSIAGQVTYAIKQMNKANVKVDGLILNDVQQGIMSKYSYHYSYAYGNIR